jgi:hypothetical protein
MARARWACAAATLAVLVAVAAGADLATIPKTGPTSMSVTIPEEKNVG